MTSKPIKSFYIMNFKGHTLPEILTVSAIILLLIASVFGTFVTTKAICYRSIAELSLQRDADVMAGRIVRGMVEQTGTFGLRSAKSFTLPNVNPAGSEIDFVGTDGNTRKYFLNGSSVIYESPTQSPNQRTIYTAPLNSGMMLRFWEPAGYMDNETVGIYISFSQQAGNANITGSVSTYVNIRNLPK